MRPVNAESRNDSSFLLHAVPPDRKVGAATRRLRRAPPAESAGQGVWRETFAIASRSLSAWMSRSVKMKYALIAASLVCFASLNSADAGLFNRKNDCCAPAPSCCAPAPTCAAPAAPSCCAPAAAPACAAPAAPTCAAPAAPSCCAPAVSHCCQTSCCGKAPKCKRFSLRDWMGKMKKNRGCCAPAPSCCAPAAPSCCAPAAAPTCAAPAAACCH